MDMCAIFDHRAVITGRQDGATAEQFGDAVIATLADPDLEAKWLSHQSR